MSTNPNSPIVDPLNELLASSYALYLKLQNYHWNVRGPLFTTLHDLFEEQYTELVDAIDEIAERIRTLGELAPGSFTDFSRLSVVEDETGRPDAETMIRTLIADHRAIATSAKKVVEAANAADDYASEDLAVGRIAAHEKNAWLLESHLE